MGIKTFLPKKEMITVPRNSEKKVLSFGFFVTITVKDKFFALLQWFSIARRYLLIGSQSFVNIAVLLFTETLKLVMLSVTVTCFTLCSIKAWCAAAVKSVHLVCASSIVLAGMTCAVIDICFEAKR